MSVYKNGPIISLKGTYQPIDSSWASGKLSSLKISDDEALYTEKRLIPPNSEDLTTLRPWMWLPMNTPLSQIEANWTTLSHLAAKENKWLSSNIYRVLNVCNFTEEDVIFSVGAPENNMVVTKGWYELLPFHCAVPSDFHFGNTFFIFARTLKGHVLKFGTGTDVKKLSAWPLRKARVH